MVNNVTVRVTKRTMENNSKDSSGFPEGDENSRHLRSSRAAGWARRVCPMAYADGRGSRFAGRRDATAKGPRNLFTHAASGRAECGRWPAGAGLDCWTTRTAAWWTRNVRNARGALYIGRAKISTKSEPPPGGGQRWGATSPAVQPSAADGQSLVTPTRRRWNSRPLSRRHNAH